MAWIYLLIAGVLEIGWPLGLKVAHGKMQLIGLVTAAICMAASGYFLWLAQRTIPIGTAYAIWTGIGAAGTFMIGVIFFGDATSLMRYMGVLLIITGVITLKLASS